MKLRDYIKTKEIEAMNNGFRKEGVKVLLIECFYHSLTNLVIDLDKDIDTSKFNDTIEKYTISGIPVQYITGYEYFYNLKFYCNKNTLIPRPETELLCDKAIEYINKYNYKDIIDIGCGTGCIGITISKNTNCNVTLVDISNDALDVARLNNNELNSNCTIIQSDLFTNIHSKYDMIVSNPPYIPNEDINTIDKIVYQNEPHLALFADDFGLYYYKKIISGLKDVLNKNGSVIFEIGYNQKQPLIDYINSLYSDCIIEVFKDYNNLDRILVIKFC